METIEARGFILTISEYGRVVRQYQDLDFERFMIISKEMIEIHLDKYSKQNNEECKNISINIYTN